MATQLPHKKTLILPQHQTQSIMPMTTFKRKISNFSTIQIGKIVEKTW